MPFFHVNAIALQEIFPGFRTRLIHSETMTFSYLEADAEAVLHEDSQSNEQVVHLLEGEFELTIDGETKRMSAGAVAVIPSNAKHSGKAITGCRFLDVHPLCKDQK